MNDAANVTNGNGDANAAVQLALQKIYVKDFSFESPHSPGIFLEADAQPVEPQIQLNLKNSHQNLPEDHVEVVLHASLHATADERTLFMIEIDQAGLFVMQGCTDEQRKTLIGTYCPASLFPYLREAISSMIGKGGFPAMLLQPINFDALFAQAMQEQAQQTARLDS